MKKLNNLSFRYRIKHRRFWWGALAGTISDGGVATSAIVSPQSVVTGLSVFVWFLVAAVSLLVVLSPTGVTSWENTKTDGRGTAYEAVTMKPPTNFLYGFSLALLIIPLTVFVLSLFLYKG